MFNSFVVTEDEVWTMWQFLNVDLKRSRSHRADFLHIKLGEGGEQRVPKCVQEGEREENRKSTRVFTEPHYRTTIIGVHRVVCPRRVGECLLKDLIEMKSTKTDPHRVQTERGKLPRPSQGAGKKKNLEGGEIIFHVSEVRPKKGEGDWVIRRGGALGLFQ